jgi:hypothetical protein
MAEIRIERKKGVPIWAILLGVILLAVLVWLFFLGWDYGYDYGSEKKVGSLERSIPVISTTLTEPAPAFVLARCA